MSKYCLLISSTRFNTIFWTFCLRRNNKCKWFVEINGRCYNMSLSTVTKASRWSPVTTTKINGSSGKNVVLHHQFIIILPLYALNNKNNPVAP